MKFSGFFLPAAFGLASAKSPEAEAYILRSWRSTQPTTTSSPSIPADVAQAILQQRLGAGGRLPHIIAEDDYEKISQFGKPIPELFTDASEDEPHQLVIILKNANEDRVKDLNKVLSGQEPTFTTPRLDYLPSSYLSWTRSRCALQDAINPDNKKCWQSKVQYLEYDVSKDQKVPATLAKNLGKLQALAKSQKPAQAAEDVKSKMETIIILLPTTSTPDAAAELRRRDFFQSEQVINEVVTTSPPSDSSASTDQSSKAPFFAAEKTGPIPACFNSQSACDAATGNCSGHGTCQNKYSQDASSACFSCRCLASLEPGENGVNRIRHWGGSACQKIDISTTFWLFAGFTIFMVAAVGFSISLLFSVGEEKLPGVIGAGVSRGAK